MSKKSVESSTKKLNSISSIAHLSPSSIALDLGANVGKITQQMADTGARVYAFEPNPFAFEVLAKRFENSTNVSCFNSAILDEDTEIALYFHKNSDEDEVLWSTGSSLLEIKSNVSKEKKTLVKAVDIAAFIKGLNCSVDLVKMDIEGVECRVINHLIDTGVINQITLLLVETHDHKIPELKEETDALRNRIKELGLEKKVNLNWI